jgi:hypothetical protein
MSGQQIAAGLTPSPNIVIESIYDRLQNVLNAQGYEQDAQSFLYAFLGRFLHDGVHESWTTLPAIHHRGT